MEPSMEPNMKRECDYLRTLLGTTATKVAALHKHPFFKGETAPLSEGNQPPDMHSNMHANITLAFRHLEDARMRLGKVLQAKDGGVSILDRQPSEDPQ